MGIVYEAVQQSLGRHVALKVLPWAGLGSNGIERFRAEARAAARLHHTNIVPVFGVGEDGGTHYFAMQFIRGQGLDQVIEELGRLRFRSEVRPSEEATIALRLRHSRFEPPEASTAGAGLSETLVMSGRAESRTRATAIANRSTRLSSEIAARSRVPSECTSMPSRGSSSRWPRRWHTPTPRASSIATSSPRTSCSTRGAPPGSPTSAWPSPTRAGATPAPVMSWGRCDTWPRKGSMASPTRSDVYGLGATFYELLTLRPLFEDVSRPRLVELVLRRDPVRPRLVDPRIPRDLEVVCLKCVAKGRDDRYDSAEQLAQELRRYLNGQTIQARRIGSFERSWRWCYRNPAVSGLLAALAASLVIGLAGVSYQWWQAKFQRDEARLAASRALLEASRADASARKEKEARTAESATRLEAQRLAARTALAQGRSLADQGAVAQGMHWMAAALRQTPPGDRDFDRLVRQNLAAYDKILARASDVLPGEPMLASAEFAADGSRLAVSLAVAGAGGRREGVVWEVATGRPAGPKIAGAFRVVLSPDGRMAAALLDGGSIAYRDVATGRPSVIPPPSEIHQAWGVAFSPDGTSVAEYGAAGTDQLTRGAIRLLHTATGKPIGRSLSFDSRVNHVTYRPDGRAIAVVCKSEVLSLWASVLSPAR